MINRDIAERIKHFYSNFGEEQITLLDHIYDKNIVFSDPFHTVNGISELQAYFRNLSENLLYCQFEFKSEAITPETLFLEWEMHYAHKSINKGNKNTLYGVSKLSVTEKIIEHRDYFDSAALIYRNVPVLKNAIQFIENRMK